MHIALCEALLLSHLSGGHLIDDELLDNSHFSGILVAQGCDGGSDCDETRFLCPPSLLDEALLRRRLVSGEQRSRDAGLVNGGFTLEASLDSTKVIQTGVRGNPADQRGRTLRIHPSLYCL